MEICNWQAAQSEAFDGLPDARLHLSHSNHIGQISRVTPMTKRNEEM
jgi:hypothetical protein